MIAKRGFASDNNSGVSEEVIAKIIEVNKGHVVGYGGDDYTGKVIELIRQKFGGECWPYLVFTGTGANVLSISAATNSINSVVCAETAHIQEDECGAPEKFSGCKLLSVETEDGKLNPELITKHLVGFDFEHHSQPKLISISQPTEMGTIYTVQEIKNIANLAHKHNMFLHVDGARLANAAVELNLPFEAFTKDAGVDILSFGGTKNGLMSAESVIFFRKELTLSFKYIRKQAMQLASKMRYMAAQFDAYFENDLWKKNASHANKMAGLLYEKVKDIPQIKITQKVEANGVFVILPKEIIEPLRNEYFFYDWNTARNEVRWMCSFDTTEEDIEGFVKKLKDLLNGKIK
ncbi:MAG: low specificity L-threonine aldolase [Bacteroidales bacterium]|nr:low specificity L-threonine aldolase [Bacteroidales bacterium]MBN2819462.1 low specificity L-threonine aldolase [Bacteroidales bacterium]